MQVIRCEQRRKVETLNFQMGLPMPPMTLAKGTPPLDPTRITTFQKDMQNHYAYFFGVNCVALQSKKCRHNRDGYFCRKIREEHKK